MNEKANEKASLTDQAVATLHVGQIIVFQVNFHKKGTSSTVGKMIHKAINSTGSKISIDQKNVSSS